MNYSTDDDKKGGLEAPPTKEYPVDEKDSGSFVSCLFGRRAEVSCRPTGLTRVLLLLLQHAHDNVEIAAVTSDLVVLPQDIDAIYDRAIALSLEEVTEILEDAWLEHSHDPNFPTQVKDKIEYFLSGDSSTLENYEMLLEEMKIEAGLIRFSSPYPEVRSVVKCEDDPSQYMSTARVWLIGTLWCGLGSFINQFFSLRQPSFTLSVNEIQLRASSVG